MTTNRSTTSAPNYRIRPSSGAAIGIYLAYMVVFSGVLAVSGVGYTELFASAGNAWRSVIPALAAGSVLLLAFLTWARWDMIWRDPARLPMSRLLWALPMLLVTIIVIRFAGLEWSRMPGDLILACVVAAGLVGFSEEMLMRGFFLRGMRGNGRNEGSAVLWTVVAFGLLHLPNVFLGTGLAGLLQLPLAALTGVPLYLFRRGFTLIVLAMAAHAFWDLSTFLSDDYQGRTTQIIDFSLVLVHAVLALVALIVIVRRDRKIALTPEGIVRQETPHPRG